jgi:hypothetical protein
MPMSNPWHLATVLHFIEHLGPESILDVGVGTGTYGFMARQFLDTSKERVAKTDWKVKIDGIEIFAPYKNPVWDYAYNCVEIGDVNDILHKMGKYDLVICNDVLEHFPKPQAQKLILEFLDHAPVVIATTPNIDIPQGAWGGNEAETHHCHLSPSDIPFIAVSLSTGITNCYVISNDKRTTTKLRESAAFCPRIRTPRVRALVSRVARKLRILRSTQ